MSVILRAFVWIGGYPHGKDQAVGKMRCGENMRQMIKLLVFITQSLGKVCGLCFPSYTTLVPLARNIIIIYVYVRSGLVWLRTNVKFTPPTRSRKHLLRLCQNVSPH